MKFGRFVLLQELEPYAIGTEFRAAKLGNSGTLERIVQVLRLSNEIAASNDIVNALGQQGKLAGQLRDAHLLSPLGIGRADGVPYFYCELAEAKSLRALLERCHADNEPLSADLSLLIARKVCEALEIVHGRKSDDAGRPVLGALNPSLVCVGYDGEVRLRLFGYLPPALRKAVEDPYGDPYRAPEQLSGQGAYDVRVDVYAVGAILFECLTGAPPMPGTGPRDLPAKLAEVGAEAFADVLGHCLAVKPEERYEDVARLSAGLGAIHLPANDGKPDRFNLAFVVHARFREEIAAENKVVEEAMQASYAEFAEPAGGPPTGAFELPPAVSGGAQRARYAAPSPAAAPMGGAAQTGASPMALSSGSKKSVGFTASPVSPRTAAGGSGLSSSSGAGLPPREASMTYSPMVPSKKSATPIIAGAAGAVVLAVVAAVFMMRKGPEVPPPTVASAPAAPAAPATPDPVVEEAKRKLQEIEAKQRELIDAQQRLLDEQRKLAEEQKKQVAAEKEKAKADTAVQKAPEPASVASADLSESPLSTPASQLLAGMPRASVPCPLFVVNPEGDTYIEAESYQLANGRVSVITGAERSAGKFVEVPQGIGNNLSPPYETDTYMVYRIYLPKPATLNLWLLGHAEDKFSDSLWMEVDGTEHIQAKVPYDWGWKRSVPPLSLGEGYHVLKLKNREDGTRVDKLLLTRGATPAGPGTAGARTSCP